MQISISDVGYILGSGLAKVNQVTGMAQYTVHTQPAVKTSYWAMLRSALPGPSPADAYFAAYLYSTLPHMNIYLF